MARPSFRRRKVGTGSGGGMGMDIAVLGVDLGKNVCSVVGLDGSGAVVMPTRARDAAVSKYEDAAEIQFSSRPGPESFQSGAASHHPAGLQAETLDCIGGVARTCRVGRRLRAGVSSSALVNPVTLTTPTAALRRERRGVQPSTILRGPALRPRCQLR